MVISSARAESVSAKMALPVQIARRVPASAIPWEGHATPPLAHVSARLASKVLYVTILTAQTIVRAVNKPVEQLAAKSARLATPAYAATGLLAQAARMLHAVPGSPAYLAMVEEHATREKTNASVLQAGVDNCAT